MRTWGLWKWIGASLMVAGALIVGAVFIYGATHFEPSGSGPAAMKREMSEYLAQAMGGLLVFALGSFLFIHQDSRI